MAAVTVQKCGQEELTHVQGKEQWLHFAGAAVKRYPMSKSGAVADRSYPTSKVRSDSHEEMPHIHHKE